MDAYSICEECESILGGIAILGVSESAVRNYCRTWPAVFDRAEGSWLTDEDGNRYLDFFAGAGGVNYGHNNPAFKGELVDYLTGNRIVHSLDMGTVAKRELLAALDRYLLGPRGLDYRVQFTGPTGAATVEAALELARKVTGRHLVLGFRDSFHGMSLGAMGVSDNSISRSAHGVAPHRQTPLVHGELSGLAEVFAERRPAAVIVETVQGEGGVHVGSAAWLRGLSALCREHGVLLIVDDIQVGCGRTGPFFSFETSGDGGPGVVPDLVCLSKSLSGYGLPLALTLIRADLDIWSPGEHSGTFRGHNLAFVTAAKALETYWADDALEKDTLAKGELVRGRLAELAAGTPWEVRGAGLINGLVLPTGEQARAVCAAAFARGLLVETAGDRGRVVKLMPPLTTTTDELEQGLGLLAASCAAA
ncbi:diaminobutyrate--2-oxoglutarate transaminase [Streptomyces sp. NPDC004111]|uniref:diaminobutyrate--2-oxoglutarate transaminase n=1 Tax=Streptomyces sp. NPDC004111 TaxID=3364690 RepID=UPI00367AE276